MPIGLSKTFQAASGRVYSRPLAA